MLESLLKERKLAFSNTINVSEQIRMFLFQKIDSSIHLFLDCKFMIVTFLDINVLYLKTKSSYMPNNFGVGINKSVSK